MKRLCGIERMLIVSASFTILLLAFRVVYSAQLMYSFYAWNLFLAAIPLFISRTLLERSFNAYKTVALLICWLIFLPNAPYIVTDVFHFTERPRVPKWFDLLLVISASWNGLMLGIVSLLQVDEFLLKIVSRVKVNIIIVISLVLSAFGIYLGRFLRFNSWDVIVNPVDLAYALGYRVIHPGQNVRTWAFTVFFGAMFSIMYFTIKKLPDLLKPGNTRIE